MTHERWSDVFRNHKWAMLGHKGGRCSKCQERAKHSTLEQFHFHHINQVKNSEDKNDRWGGAVRKWPPFTDKWFEWAQRVELICELCHKKQHGRGKDQLSLLDYIEVQKRLDEAAENNNSINNIIEWPKRRTGGS